MGNQTLIELGLKSYQLEDFYEILESALKTGTTSDLIFAPGIAPRSHQIYGFTDHMIPTLQEVDTLLIAKELLQDRFNLELEEIEDCSYIPEEMTKGFSWEVGYNYANKGRFRASICKSKGSFRICLRVIPLKIPNFQKLNLPSQVENLATLSSGLVLVTGATGQGKSTTIAAILEEINRSELWHIVTLEDPIEFNYLDKRSVVMQREVHTDVESYERGIRDALRQKAKVIMFGEILTREQFDLALKAAQTGHLVLSTIQSYDVVTALDYIANFYHTEEERINVRNQLSRRLRAVVCQRLVPTSQTSNCEDWVLPALEIFFNNSPLIAQCIAEGKFKELYQYMEKSYQKKADKPSETMQTFDQHLFSLLEQGLIDKAIALDNSTNPAEIERRHQEIGAHIKNKYF